MLPNGDVLVAETNGPSRPDDAKGIKGWVMGLFKKRAGATVPSANRITLLRDTDGDGVAGLRSVLASARPASSCWICLRARSTTTGPRT